jgi:C4-dicarboxylate-specific signal transduction histidine kinase
MENTDNKHYLDYVIDGMRKTADELEKFQLQASLGKMEALDKYDELKKTYAHYSNEIKIKAEEGREKLQDLQSKFQHLQVQFALGKAETIETFEEQKHRILLAIHELQVTIKNNPTFIQTYAVLLDLLEKLKLKLEILSEKLDPLKEKAKEVYSERKKDLEEMIESFRKKIKDQTDIEHRMEVFQDELAMAYKHFKKAFVQS